MMQGMKIYRWMLIAWLLLCSVSSAWAWGQTTPSAAWNAAPTMSQDVYPTYQFRSTSTCQPIVGQTSYTSNPYAPGATGVRRAQRDGEGTTYNPEGWNEDENEPIGFVNTEPVGEPYILLLLAALYMAVVGLKRMRQERRK